MRETGFVVKTEKNIAKVKVDKKDECSKCGMCLFPQGANSIDFIADNKMGAKVGDSVVIERKTDAKFLGAVLVFLIPLILIGVSAILGFLIIKSDLSVLILSVTLIILWYVILSKIDKNLKKASSFRAIVVEIVKEQ